jgi:hypothetical protein
MKNLVSFARVSFALFLIRTFFTYFFGDLLKISEYLVFPFLYIFIIYISFKLNKFILFKNSNLQLKNFVIYYLIFFIFESTLYYFLSNYISLQSLKLITLAPVTSLFRYFYYKFIFSRH